MRRERRLRAPRPAPSCWDAGARDPAGGRPTTFWSGPHQSPQRPTVSLYELGSELNQGVWAVSWRLYAARATAFLGEPAFSQLGRGPLPRSTRTVETGNRSRRSRGAARAVYPPGAPQGAANKSACERISERSIINHTVTVSFERYNVGYTHFPWSMHLEQTVARVGRDPGARRTTDARISSVSRVRRGPCPFETPCERA